MPWASISVKIFNLTKFKGYFELFIKSKSLAEYADFIIQFPYNRNIEIAWRKLYQLFMVDYTENRIQQFQQDYPNYPFTAELEQDIKYAQRRIIPFKENGLLIFFFLFIGLLGYLIMVFV